MQTFVTEAPATISAEHKQRDNQTVPRVRYTKVGRQALFAGQCKSG